ncbi:MAG: MFS transporter, partial [Methanosarcinales archaeon]
GTYFAYGLQHAGSDWQTVYVRNAVTGEQLPDKIQWTKFSSLAWTHDNAGFFYTRHPAPAVIAGSDAESGAAGTETTATTHSMVLYHRLGTSEAEDVLVYARADEPVWRFGLEVTDDGEYLIITIHKGTDPVNRLYAAHLPSVWSAWLSTRSPLTLSHSALPPAMSEYTYLPLMHVIHNFEGQFEYVCNDGTSFLFKTNYEAPRARVVELILTVDAAAHVSQPPAQDASVPPLRNVIPEHASNVLDWCSVFDTATLMCCYMEDVKNVLTTQVLSTNGACEHVVTNLSTVPLPGPGTIMGAFGQRFCDTAFVKFVSFVHPGTIIKIQTDAAARVAVSEDVYNTRIEGFDPRAYSVEQRFVLARWGTATLFFTNGIVMASWASRVPAVQQHLRLSEGKLGLALLGMAVGGLIAMPITAWLLTRYDQQRIARLGTLLLCLALPLPAFAFSSVSLFVALVILGAGSGAMNVAVNSQGNHIEAQFPRPIMASFHALFSLGGMVGALIGAGMASAHVSPLAHLIIVAVCFVIAVLYATKFVLPVLATASTASTTRSPLSTTLRALIGLGTIAFVTVFIEGAISDVRNEDSPSNNDAAHEQPTLSPSMVSETAAREHYSPLPRSKRLLWATLLYGGAFFVQLFFFLFF